MQVSHLIHVDENLIKYQVVIQILLLEVLLYLHTCIHTYNVIQTSPDFCQNYMHHLYSMPRSKVISNCYNNYVAVLPAIVVLAGRLSAT